MACESLCNAVTGPASARAAEHRGACTGCQAECAVRRTRAKRQQPSAAQRAPGHRGVGRRKARLPSLAHAAAPAGRPGGRVLFLMLSSMKGEKNVSISQVSCEEGRTDRKSVV